MRSPWFAAALLAAGCAARAPVELSRPLMVEPVLGMPRVCVPMFEAAGRFPKKEAESWGAARAALAATDGRGAVSALESVAEHPARRAVAAAAGILDADAEADLAYEQRALDELLLAWPDDGCLQLLAGIQALQAGDREVAVPRLARAYELMPDDPDARLMHTVMSATDPVAMSEALVAAADAHPGHAATQVMAGRASVAVGELDGAAKVLERASDLGVEDARVAVFHLWRMTGALERYLGRAVEDALPVAAPAFGAEGRVERYETWLGLDPAKDDSLTAVLHTTLGDVRCVLFHREAPVTVINFVALARGEQAWVDPASGDSVDRPLYSGTRFHRVIPGFMIQGGDPLGDGTGFPGYRFPDELHPAIGFDRPGLLAMANSGPDTNGSQFFVTEGPTPHLDGMHTIFGACDDASLATVSAIANVPVDGDDRPLTDVLLTSIEFVRSADAPGAAP